MEVIKKYKIGTGYDWPWGLGLKDYVQIVVWQKGRDTRLKLKDHVGKIGGQLWGVVFTRIKDLQGRIISKQTIKLNKKHVLP